MDRPDFCMPGKHGMRLIGELIKIVPDKLEIVNESS